MLINAAQTIVVIFSLLMLVLGAVGLIAPFYLLRFGRAIWSAAHGMTLAVALRLVLGLSLYLAAPVSRFPDTFRVLGIIVVAAALIIPFAGRERISRLLDWGSRQPAWVLRLWLGFGFAVGAFILYAAVDPAYSITSA